MAKYIMMQGTSSHVGKSILVTALCRIFYQDGLHVVPFKAQNMALNSYVTRDGKEMGRAQVAQAEAAGLEPMVDMNPVLLKPTGNQSSQVVLMGKPVGNMSARDYHKGYSIKLFDTVKGALGRLSDDYEVVVIEGAGSPAEVNLHDNDIVNMRVAKYLGAPVLLIADIDRGGALASLVGTLELLTPEERDLVKGLIINKFRGDVTLLEPAVKFLEEKTGKPVLGIIPHIEHMGIDDEDSVSLEDKNEKPQYNDVTIAVIRTPKISNFTDFDCLAGEEDVALYYVDSVESFGAPDLIMLPGSKNTTEDMIYLRESGLEAKIKERVKAGVPLIGICGGYQMLGEEIRDPHHTESNKDGTQGLGLLEMTTTFSAEKLTSQVTADCHELEFLGKKISANNLKGYEIHMGTTKCVSNALLDCGGAYEGNVYGCYIHGIFDSEQVSERLVKKLYERKGIAYRGGVADRDAYKEKQFDMLAEGVRRSIDTELLYRIIEEGI